MVFQIFTLFWYEKPDTVPFLPEEYYNLAKTDQIKEVYMDSKLLSADWNNIKEIVRKEYEISDISYNVWLDKLDIADVEGDTVSLLIPNNNEKMISYYNKKFLDFFQIVISEEMNEPCRVIFTTKSALEQNTDEGQHAPETDDDQKGLSLRIREANLNAKYCFDTFVVGNNNRFAHSACLAVADAPGQFYNPLFLYGGPGLGKTHLMNCIGNYIVQHNPNMKVLYVTTENFTNEVISSIRSGDAAEKMQRLREKYRTIDVLLIDDIQFIINKESTQSEFFHTFNELYSAGKQIVMSSDRPPKELETLNERIRSRFEMGLIADIQAPDYETRMAILQKLAEEEKRDIPDDIMEYIASNIKSNIRELEGAYHKIIAYSRLNKVSITLDNAKEALKDIIYPNQDHTVTPSMIMSVVCEHYGVSKENIISRKKSADISVPRQIIMYLCRKYTDTTYEGIAKILHKKDHSTILYGCNAISEQIKTDENLRSNINIILKKLNLPT